MIIPEQEINPECEKCTKLDELFKLIPNPTNRDYWLMTELFMSLHDGKDYCR